MALCPRASPLTSARLIRFRLAPLRCHVSAARLRALADWKHRKKETFTKDLEARKREQMEVWRAAPHETVRTSYTAAAAEAPSHLAQYTDALTETWRYVWLVGGGREEKRLEATAAGVASAGEGTQGGGGGDGAKEGGGDDEVSRCALQLQQQQQPRSSTARAASSTRLIHLLTLWSLT